MEENQATLLRKTVIQHIEQIITRIRSNTYYQWAGEPRTQLLRNLLAAYDAKRDRLYNHEHTFEFWQNAAVEGNKYPDDEPWGLHMMLNLV